jgi:glycyl-tRNA synthetase beta chain
MANFAKRRQAIVEGLVHKAQGDVVVQPEALLDEVWALVEWPVVYEGQFEPSFLNVPQECLMLTMQANQKYFAVTTAQGKLTPRFLLVSNLYTATPAAIIHGNERVLRARLADAQFFFEQDLKRSLASRVPQLAQVVYHNKLGNQLQRNQRIVALAMQLAPACGANINEVQQAAQWCKADLLTEMVGEFPELQGIMGQYYAQYDGASPAVAQAIAEHYQPRFAGDALPRGPVGLTLALADKLETLVGMFGIDLAPTGDKDPFALRRHALGVARILIDSQCLLNVQSTLQQAESLFADCPAFSPRSQALYTFMQDRLRSHLAAEGHAPQAIEAVLAANPIHWADLPARLEAVRTFGTLPEAQALAAANKRIHNILKKNDVPLALATQGEPLHLTTDAINTSLLCEPAEITLAQTLATLRPIAQAAYQEKRYNQALQTLAAFKTPVDDFFAQVMVMDNNPALRNNRLCLLGQLHALMNHIADLAQLSNT